MLQKMILHTEEARRPFTANNRDNKYFLKVSTGIILKFEVAGFLNYCFFLFIFHQGANGNPGEQGLAGEMGMKVSNIHLSLFVILENNFQIFKLRRTLRQSRNKKTFK